MCLFAASREICKISKEIKVILQEIYINKLLKNKKPVAFKGIYLGKKK